MENDQLSFWTSLQNMEFPQVINVQLYSASRCTYRYLILRAISGELTPELELNTELLRLPINMLTLPRRKNRFVKQLAYLHDPDQDVPDQRATWSFDQNVEALISVPTRGTDVNEWSPKTIHLMLEQNCQCRVLHMVFFYRLLRPGWA